MDRNNPRIFSKTCIAEKLNITYRCMFNYHDLCYHLLPEFKADYPLIEGNAYTRDNLTLYQFWVISEVYNDFKGRPRKTTEYFLKDKEWAKKYSKNAFLEAQFSRSTAQEISSIVLAS